MLSVAKLALSLPVLGDAALWAVAIVCLLKITHGVDAIVKRLEKKPV